MLRERVAENVYVFTSEAYAQVNAGAVIGPEWSVLIDTLALPEETLEVKDFVEKRLGRPVRYVVNTHYHSDHTLGNALFPKAMVVSHTRCRDLLDSRGREALEEAREHSRELRDVKLHLPELTFDRGELTLRAGRRTMRLIPLPGHSPDGIGVLVVEDRVLFAGDVMMPIPYLADGNYDHMLASLKAIPRMKLENLVQGHGESVLRGEVANAVRSNLQYLSAIRRHVRRAARLRDGEAYLMEVDIEECGKSRILMNGLAEQLHARNLVALYRQWSDTR
jgi:glyoxylase-like metal-dependent hydrolase (beta-lactamase superfamily II)